MKWGRKEGDDPSRGSRTHASFLQESFTMKTIRNGPLVLI